MAITRSQTAAAQSNLDYWAQLPKQSPWIEVRRRDQVAHLDKINGIVEQLPETRNEGWTLCDHFMDTYWWDDVKWSGDCAFQITYGARTHSLCQEIADDV